MKRTRNTERTKRAAIYADIQREMREEVEQVRGTHTRRATLLVRVR